MNGNVSHKAILSRIIQQNFTTTGIIIVYFIKYEISFLTSYMLFIGFFRFAHDKKLTVSDASGNRMKILETQLLIMQNKEYCYTVRDKDVYLKFHYV